MNMQKWVWLAAVGSLGVAGCSAAEGRAPEAQGPQSDTIVEHGTRTEARPFSETVVRFQPDGTRHIEISYLSASEVTAAGAAGRSAHGSERAGNVGSAPPNTFFRPTCFGADLRLWDQREFAGNSICFFARAGVQLIANLDHYGRAGDQTWAHAVGSYAFESGLSTLPTAAMSFFDGWLAAHEETVPVPDAGDSPGSGEETVLVPAGPDYSTQCRSIAPGTSVAQASTCVAGSVALTIGKI